MEQVSQGMGNVLFPIYIAAHGIDNRRVHNILRVLRNKEDSIV